MNADTQQAQNIGQFFRNLTMERLVPALCVLAVGAVLVRLALHLLDKAMTRSRLAKTAHAMLRSGVHILLDFVLALIVASQLNVNVTSLVALLSVVSLAVSLAVQGALSNLVGGVTVLTTHPFQAGDYVQIGGDEGSVVEVGMTYTTLVTPDNKRVYLPNSKVTSSEIVNFSVNGTRRVDISVTASYDTPTDAVRSALLAAARISQALEQPTPFVGVVGYGENSIEYILQFWVNSADYLDARFTVTERIRAAFREAGAEMNYPYLNVCLNKPEPR